MSTFADSFAEAVQRVRPETVDIPEGRVLDEEYSDCCGAGCAVVEVGDLLDARDLPWEAWFRIADQYSRDDLALVCRHCGRVDGELDVPT